MIMKTISIFILLVYWSIILSAPVIMKNYKIVEEKPFYSPELKFKDTNF